MRLRYLTSAAAITTVILLGTQIPSWFSIEVVETKPLGHRPDFVVTNFINRETDTAGKLTQTTRGERLTHYADDDTAVVTQPDLMLFSDIRPPWRIQSAQALFSGDGEQVMLAGNVHMARAGADQLAPIEIATHDLTVYPKRDFAETKAAVLVTSRQDYTRAVGLEAHLGKQELIRLLADVKGRYENNSNY